MKLREVWIVIALVLLVGAGLFAWVQAKRGEFHVSEARLQAHVSRQFPLERNMLLLLLLRWRLSRPALHLLPQRQRVALGLDVHLSARLEGQSVDLGGRVEVEAGLRADAARHAVFLVDPVIVQLVLAGIPESQLLRVQDSLRSLLSEWFARNPIHALPASRFGTAVRPARYELHIEADEIVVEPAA